MRLLSAVWQMDERTDVAHTAEHVMRTAATLLAWHRLSLWAIWATGRLNAQDGNRGETGDNRFLPQRLTVFASDRNNCNSLGTTYSMDMGKKNLALWMTEL